MTIHVAGPPSSYCSAHEKPWKDAVRAAVAATGVQLQDVRFAVRLEFRIAAPRNASEVRDLDNLVKPALDAMEGIFGLRPWKGHPQAADGKAGRLEASRRLSREGELAGAAIGVRVITPDWPEE